MWANFALAVHHENEVLKVLERSRGIRRLLSGFAADPDERWLKWGCSGRGENLGLDPPPADPDPHFFYPFWTRTGCRYAACETK